MFYGDCLILYWMCWLFTTSPCGMSGITLYYIYTMTRTTGNQILSEQLCVGYNCFHITCIWLFNLSRHKWAWFYLQENWTLEEYKKPIPHGPCYMKNTIVASCLWTQNATKAHYFFIWRFVSGIKTHNAAKYHQMRFIPISPIIQANLFESASLHQLHNIFRQSGNSQDITNTGIC